MSEQLMSQVRPAVRLQSWRKLSSKHRGRRLRDGSVLILVVALLVLLALIGTAFITTTGGDRVASGQHEANTETEMLIEGLKQMAAARLVAPISPGDPPGTAGPPTAVAAGPTTYRPALPTNRQVAAEAAPFDMNNPWREYSNITYGPWDVVLASRYPGRLPGAPAGSTPVWHTISGSPLAMSRHATDPTYFPDQFQSPYVKNTGTPNTSSPANYGSRVGNVPYFVDITYPNGVVKRFPALGISSLAGTDPAAGMIALAADTDGDGIADAGLFDLQLGQIDGVRYYGAIRVIDNSAAINASIAINPMTSSDPQFARLPANAFPTNINLFSLVMPPEAAGTNPNFAPNPNAFDQFNQFRFAANTMGLGTGTAYEFATRYDAFWTQLGSRLDNPGFNYLGSGQRTRALGLAETVVNASRFCLADLSGPQSILDRAFPHAMRMPSVSRAPFDPASAFDNPAAPAGQRWFESIFDYDNLPADQVPLRPLVVGHNAVTNFVPSFLGDPKTPLAEDQRLGRYQYRGTWPEHVDNDPTLHPGTYHVGDWVRYTDWRTGQPRAYVCVRTHGWTKMRGSVNETPNPASFPPVFPVVGNNPAYPVLTHWAEVPWYSHPVKTNINTANYGQLFAMYSAIMADGPLARPGSAGGPPAATPPYTNEVGRGGYNGGPYDDDYFTFGNVLRPTVGDDPAQPPRKIPARFVKQLRAAQAAVNTIDLRDHDEDVTSRTVALTEDNGAIAYVAQVFGSERQPYITESIVHIPEVLTDTYVAVELFNPHPYPIKLDAFGLYRRARDPADPDGTGMVEIVSLAGKQIPAGGYFYIENRRDKRPEDMVNEITADPALATKLDGAATSIEENKLEDVLKHGATRELFLLRTRRNDGTRVNNSTSLANPFNESAGPDHFVPVDQLEYVGIREEIPPPTAENPAPMPMPTRYHYRRATAGDARWHCVYGGPYNPRPLAGERRQKGWIQQLPADPAMPVFDLPAFCRRMMSSDKAPTTADVTLFQVRGPVPNGLSTYRTRSLQINATGSAGPWKPRTFGASGDHNILPPAPTPLLPAGGFLRAGDVMQVTYCGAHRLFAVGRPAQEDIPAALPEVNTVSMDAAFVDDGDANDNFSSGTQPLEQLGRFCPIDNGSTIRDIAIPPVGRRYAWATDLFDYVTVISPQDDYSPNVDPDVYLDPDKVSYYSGDPTVPGSAPKWPLQANVPANGQAWGTSPGLPPLNEPPPPIANGLKVTSPDLANKGREDVAAIHGLINVNTANWKVLSMLPFTDNQMTNDTIAKDIVAFRDSVSATAPGRPFRNLFDLMNVPAIQTVQTTLNGVDPDNTLGDVTPVMGDVGGGDFSPGDFEARYLMINRISNMVTFRSDSFTVYVMVQGWRNAGTTVPELVTQRRAAFVLDRSTVLPVIPPVSSGPWPGVTVTSPSITNIPQN